MGIEIVNGALVVWTAPVGEAYPDISEAPAGNWLKIGTNGARHYNEEGVSLEASQEFEKRFGLGGTELLKIMRVQEEFKIKFTLFDLFSLEHVKAFNLAVGTTDVAAASGTGGHQKFGLLRGLVVNEQAVLIRGEDMSSDLVTENLQWEIPKMAQVGNIELGFSKGGEAGLAFELQAIADYTYDSGNSPYGQFLSGDEIPLA